MSKLLICQITPTNKRKNQNGIGRVGAGSRKGKGEEEE
jgi:hypothetical protein